ncbi:MAG: lipocalin-like domain-containing protein, partial [Vicinamibacteria bacterium]
TFPPGVGHERHYHRPHFGYALSGGRVRITDASGVRESVPVTGSIFTSAGVAWHEVLNIGETTVQYLIVESKAEDAVAAARRPFVGGWELESLLTHWPDGRVSRPWGDHPKGRLSYDGDGRMSVVMMHEERDQADRVSVPDDLRDEEAGYFGAYTVDPTRRLVFHHVAASLRHSESGTIERSYEFKEGGPRVRDQRQGGRCRGQDLSDLETAGGNAAAIS